VPGTTRDVIAAPAVLLGWSVELIDTAGSRDDDEPASATEQAGIARAEAARATADLIVRVVPAEDVGRGELPAGPDELAVVSKIDRSPPGRRPGMRASRNSSPPSSPGSCRSRGMTPACSPVPYRSRPARWT
jgi:hypothetical protein